MEERKLPVGIQSFEQIVQDKYLLIDKTEYIYKLVHTGKPYFLSRPRRFGKSLLLSTMKAYWEGKRELFRGLAIERLEQDDPEAWQTYPVLYFDFNGNDYQGKGSLENALNAQLMSWEEQYHTLTDTNLSLGDRFKRVLRAASEQTGKRCVVLVDEYDKPLLETMGNRELVEHNKAVFKGFFSSLKSEDAYIRFVFITGVTKFSKVSIFSDLNQLRDISMSMDYAEICGITEQEMTDVFMPEIDALAEEQDMSRSECLFKLKKEYDGYHFHQKGEGVYNPYSLLCAFADREFDAYWFETGTPTFLAERLKKLQFDPRRFTDNTIFATKSELKDYRDDNPDVIPLLYQTGYLTISEYDTAKSAYTLGFPNEEVRVSFIKGLMPYYTKTSASQNNSFIVRLIDALDNGDVDKAMILMRSFFSSIPYDAEKQNENHYKTVFYLVFTLATEYCVRTEERSAAGRCDALIETEDTIYVFEFKLDGTAEEALKQIDDKGYAIQYEAGDKKIVKIGVNFEKDKRTIERWVIR